MEFSDKDFHVAIGELVKKGYIEVLGWTEDEGIRFRRTKKFWQYIREKNGGEIPSDYWKTYATDIEVWEGN